MNYLPKKDVKSKSSSVAFQCSGSMTSLSLQVFAILCSPSSVQWLCPQICSPCHEVDSSFRYHIQDQQHLKTGEGTTPTHVSLKSGENVFRSPLIDFSHHIDRNWVVLPNLNQNCLSWERAYRTIGLDQSGLIRGWALGWGQPPLKPMA